MDRTDNFDDLQGLLQKKDYRLLKDELEQMKEVDIAQFLTDLESEEQVVLAFRCLDKEMGAEVFSNLEPEVQEQIINAINDKELREIMDELFVDDAVDMLEEMPANVVTRVLKNTAPEDRKILNQFLQYPEDSAGSIMTAEFIDLRDTMTVEDAIKRIRRVGDEKETIYNCYVVDGTNRLKGVITIKHLLMSQDDDYVVDVMDDDVLKVKTTDDQEAVARLFSKYDLLALPVVDKEDRLVGIITVDDAVDVMEEEATEDFEQMAGLMPSEKPYLREDIFSLFKNRILWLLILMLAGTLSALILGSNESVLVTFPVLIASLPMLMDTCGNAGSQAGTTVIRGMALEEIEEEDLLEVLWKEFRLAALCGVCLAVVNLVRMFLMYPGRTAEAIAVSVAMFLAIILSNLVSVLLPLGVKALHFDPATVASPMLTTVVDVVTLLVYAGVVRVLM